VCGDLISNLIYYGFGRAGRGVRGGLNPELRIALVSDAGRMLLVGKWTHSLGCGAHRQRHGAVPLARFLLVNLLATLPKIALLFGVDYFVGDNFYCWKTVPL
jgi:hypothetical protein